MMRKPCVWLLLIMPWRNIRG